MVHICHVKQNPHLRHQIIMILFTDTCFGKVSVSGNSVTKMLSPGIGKQ